MKNAGIAQTHKLFFFNIKRNKKVITWKIEVKKGLVWIIVKIKTNIFLKRTNTLLLFTTMIETQKIKTLRYLKKCREPFL
jgi:hypothetical protein